MSVNADQMKLRVYSYMLATRGGKYIGIIAALRTFNLISRYVLLSPERGDLLESYYVMMRYIDDIVDGDAPLPRGFSSPADYVNNKIEFSERIRNAEAQPRDVVDSLMLHCYDLADKLHFGIHEETQDILSSMLFDAERYGKMTIFSKKELDDHFYVLDIRGTIRGAIKVFGDDPAKYPAIEPLGEASRNYYNLQDCLQDCRAGIPNITLEDMAGYGITSDDILAMAGDNLGRKLKPEDLHRLPPSVQSWFLAEAAEGLISIKDFKQRVAEAEISAFARGTLYLMYEAPANNFFRGVLEKLS